jgi:hypothetical protein
MLALILGAHAGDVVLHAGVGVIDRFLPMSTAVEHTAARLELGAGVPSFQGYVVAQIGAHNTTAIWEVGGGFPGDFLLTNVGVGGRFPLSPLGRLRVIPHVEVGASLFDAPIATGAARDLSEEFVLVYPSQSVGAWAQFGCDVGVSVFDDVVTAYAGLDAGYATNPGIGLIAAPRLGLAANF